MPNRGGVYGPEYRRLRKLLLGRPCQLRLVCQGAPADSADHWPPLALHRHEPGTGCCVLQPACQDCQNVQGATIARTRKLRMPAPSRQW